MSFSVEYIISVSMLSMELSIIFISKTNTTVISMPEKKIL